MTDGSTRFPKRALSIGEVVDATGFSRSSIYEALNSGALKAVKYGRRTAVTAEALDEFLDSLPPATFPKNQSASAAA